MQSVASFWPRQRMVCCPRWSWCHRYTPATAVPATTSVLDVMWHTSVAVRQTTHERLCGYKVTCNSDMPQVNTGYKSDAHYLSKQWLSPSSLASRRKVFCKPRQRETPENCTLTGGGTRRYISIIPEAHSRWWEFDCPEVHSQERLLLPTLELAL